MRVIWNVMVSDAICITASRCPPTKLCVLAALAAQTMLFSSHEDREVRIDQTSDGVNPKLCTVSGSSARNSSNFFSCPRTYASTGKRGAHIGEL
jgi:hypothetical protein